MKTFSVLIMFTIEKKISQNGSDSSSVGTDPICLSVFTVNVMTQRSVVCLGESKDPNMDKLMIMT